MMPIMYIAQQKGEKGWKQVGEELALVVHGNLWGSTQKLPFRVLCWETARLLGR